jgi:hypothetical protein
MNLRRIVLLFTIVLLGIFAIDTFVFPMQEGGCSCGMGEEIYQILCAGFCPDEECSVGNSVYGWCEDTKCVTRVVILCLETGERKDYRWWEPCFQCNEY